MILSTVNSKFFSLESFHLNFTFFHFPAHCVMIKTILGKSILCIYVKRIQCEFHFFSHVISNPQKNISPPKAETLECITNFFCSRMYVWLLGLDTSGPNEVVKECQNLIITKSHTLLKEGLDVKTRI